MIPEETTGTGSESALRRGFLLLQPGEWLLALGLGLGLATLLFPLYRHISPWVGATLFLVGVIVVHLRYSCRFIVPAPHLFLLIAAIQYVLAAWASVRFPGGDPVSNIESDAVPLYLGYASLVLLACTIGSGSAWRCCARGRRGRSRLLELLANFDAMILAGLLASSQRIRPPE